MKDMGARNSYEMDKENNDNVVAACCVRWIFKSTGGI